MKHRVVEELSVFTPLGLRFWDPAVDGPVRAGLAVRARRAGTLRPVARAYRTRSDVYAFRHLPGLADLEHGLTPEASPPGQEYLVEVADARRRYVPIAFTVELPLGYPGLFLVGEPVSPGGAAPEGVFLFSAPSRPIPSHLAALMGDLVDAGTGEPAAHAVVRALFHDGAVGHGVADASGLLVLLPYPSLEEPFAGPPPSPPASPPAAGPGTTLSDQTWGFALQVSYTPASLVAHPGTDVPDYSSVLEQSPGSVFAVPPEDGGAPAPALAGTLRFGETAVLRTSGRSELLVSSSDT